MEAKPTRRELTHERIVEVASRALRRGGFAGVGVADVMKQAGLTHGGFYAHFASREALLAEAIERAGRDSAASIAKRSASRQARGSSAFRALVEIYLSDAHLAGTEHGCPVAALSSEMPRQAPELQASSATRVRRLIARAAETLAPGHAPEAAAVVASTLLGALQLARALGDNAEGKAVLAAARASLIERYDGAGA